MHVIINIVFIIGLLLSSVAQAADNVTIIPRYDVATYDQYLTNLIAKQPVDSQEKLEYFSAAFLQKPYLLGALGEGQDGQFDKSPLYRTDGFDCLTYVSTVLALIHANDLQQFKQNIKNVNYQKGHVSYQHRNHFTSTDWNHANQQQGYIKDITTTIRDQAGNAVTKQAVAYINKKAWYAQKPLSSIKLFAALTSEQQQKRLNQLHALSNDVVNQESYLSYIPLTALFDENQQANRFLFDQIPSGTIIEIVRPNWNVKSYIGTNLNVSHVGFGMRTKDGLLNYREASSIEKKVIDIPLSDYLRQYLNSPSVKGINVQYIIPIASKT